MRQVISFDWDFVTGDCNVNGYGCDYKCKGCGERGRGQNDRVNPNWNKKFEQVYTMINNNKFSNIVYRNCHADIISWLNFGDTILHIDDHDDATNYGDYTSLCCGNWRLYADKIDATSEQIFDPSGILVHGTSMLFICRSDNYTPKNMDQHLTILLESLGISSLKSYTKMDENQKKIIRLLRSD